MSQDVTDRMSRHVVESDNLMEHTNDIRLSIAPVGSAIYLYSFYAKLCCSKYIIIVVINATNLSLIMQPGGARFTMKTNEKFYLNFTLIKSKSYYNLDKI